MFDYENHPTDAATTLADASRRLESALDAFHRAAAAAPASERAVVVCDALKRADDLIRASIAALGTGNGIAAATGMPAEMVLMMDGRRTFGEARTLLHAAETLRAMPFLASAFAAGRVSWPQVQEIVRTVDRVTADQRAELDALVGRRAEELLEADPDQLTFAVAARADALQPDEHARRETRQIAATSLRIQARLDGSGTIVADADAVSLATIVEAVEAVADPPTGSRAGSRAHQLFDGLVRVCERSLAGDGSGLGRPRARVLATIDLDSLERGEDSARLLWQAHNGPIRISNVTARTLLCDASIVPIVVQNGRPVAVGNEFKPFSDKVRRAVLALDGKCRFPTCRRPVQWADVHHIEPGVGWSVDDGAALCALHHHRVHRLGWKMTMMPDRRLIFRRNGRKYVTYPRGSPASS